MAPTSFAYRSRDGLDIAAYRWDTDTTSPRAIAAMPTDLLAWLDRVVPG